MDFGEADGIIGGKLTRFHFCMDLPHSDSPFIKAYVPFTAVGGELLFEVLSRRYERGSTLITSNLPFDEWTLVFGSERLTGALLDRLTHHVHIREMNGESFRLASSRKRQKDKEGSKMT